MKMKMTIHFKKEKQDFEHLIFTLCGKYDRKENVEWNKRLTSDKSKVKCENCKKRMMR